MTDALTEALGELQELISAEEDPKEVARLLYSLQKFRSLLSDVIDDAHSRLAGLMKQREVDLGPGIGVVRKQRDVKSRWNHEGMLKLLLEDLRKVNLETGETEIDGYELASAIQECVAFSYWRKTPLRSRKIDFEEFVHEEYGHPRVRFLSKEGS